MAKLSCTALAATLLCGALVGCGEPIDPLADLRVERSTWPGPDEAAPNAVLVAGSPLAERLIAELVNGSNFASPPGPFGLRLIVLPTVDRAAMTLEGGEPLAVSLDVAGTADLRTGFGGPSDLPWTAAVTGEIALNATSDPDGLHLELVLPQPDSLSVDVALEGMDGGAGAMASGAASGAIEAAITGPFAEPLTSTLKPGPATPRDVRPRAVPGGLALDLVLPALGAPAPPAELPDPEDGFVVQVPLQTVLGFAKAVASAQLMTAPALIEPDAISVDDGNLVLEGKVHKTARREKWRRYRAVTDLGIRDEHLTALLLDLELLEKNHWAGGPVAAIAESSAPARLTAFADQVTTTFRFTLGPKRLMVVEITDIACTGSFVTLHGTARVEAAPEAPATPE